MLKFYSLLFFISTTNSFAQASNDEVQAVINLRQDVEVLSLEVENVKKSNQALMDTYIQREQELSAMLIREKFRSDQIKSQIALGKNKIYSNQVNMTTKSDTNWLVKFWMRYEDSLKKANPLYSNRLKEKLQKIKLDYKDKRLSYEHALMQTWFIVDEDLKKSQDTEYHLAPLSLEGKNYNLEMVRLGRTKGYFRSAEGKYGLLELKDKWAVTYFEDKESITKIDLLLSQFKQQQKTGLFNLPGMSL